MCCVTSHFLSLNLWDDKVNAPFASALAKRLIIDSVEDSYVWHAITEPAHTAAAIWD